MNYQKYQDNLTCAQQLQESQGSDKSGSGSGYQQYMDYSKYMGGGQGGGYQQYMNYSKYMGGGHGGGYQQYMDYQKYMGGGSAGGGQSDKASEPVELVSVDSDKEYQ